MTQYLALLRGINVGGHKKVPMPQLKQLFESLGYTNVKTILNTGNVLFETGESQASLVNKIQTAVKDNFGFEVPVQVRPFSQLQDMVHDNPFTQLASDKSTHWYVTFLNQANANLPQSPDPAIKFLAINHKAMFSTINHAQAKSVDFMAVLDKNFGKTVTTRNWNTIQRIIKASS